MLDPISTAAGVAARPRQKTLSFFEFWPGWLFYTPIRLYCFWLAMRFRGLTLPANANPLFDAGGLVGESKSQILRQAPSELEPLFAAHVLTARTELGVASDVANAKQQMAVADLAYPLVAKPDIGCRGMGVQIVTNDAELEKYLQQFPVGHNVMLQRLHDYPHEAGLFYIRHPDWAQGIIFSLTIKQFAYVTGDGRVSLRQLIETDPRAGKIAHLYLPRHRANWDWVVPAGEKFRIAFAGSHSRGTIFKDGVRLITPAMVENWDRLCRQIPEFYFGRFDVRYHNLADLENATNIKIVEINGAGAEATHIWDADCSLWAAYKTLGKQYWHAFAIGAKNRARGFAPLRILELRRYYKLHRKLANLYPHTH
jgi:hypothetical protein